jgi:aspartyl aminopeptidase
MSELSYKRTNVYEKADEKLLKEIFCYAEGYKQFIDAGKTEREACAFAKEAAIKAGYKPFTFGQTLKAGDKVFYDNRGKNLYLIKIGENDVAEDGVRIIASHIDSPRIDFKQVPLYEAENIAFAKTHYYGGVRKYQWVSVPLSLPFLASL